MVQLAPNSRPVEVDMCVPNPSNPNEMDNDHFNALCDSIRTEGFVEPIQVVPEADSGRFLIVGGEHRWRAMVALDQKMIPAVVLDPDQWDEDRQKWNLVKLNVVRGKLNPLKFTELYQDLAKRHSEEALQTLMGFTTEDAFQSMYRDVRRSLPPEMQKAIDDAKEEIKTIDDLSLILNGLFREYGETLPSDVMAFSWGGREVLWVLCSNELFKLVKDIETDVVDSGANMSVRLFEMLKEK